MNIANMVNNTSALLGFLLGFVLCSVFVYLIVDNILLRRKIFKMYERFIIFERQKNYKSTLDYDKVLKWVK